MGDGNNIISDMNFRRVIVKGVSEAKAIKELSLSSGTLYKIRELHYGIYEIEIFL